MTRRVDNQDIGALYATFEINRTGADYDLSSEEIGGAVALTDNNRISLGMDGGKVLGCLKHVCGGLATVQICGVTRLNLNLDKTLPTVGDGVVLDGAGKVYQAPAIPGAAGDPVGGNVARGITLAVNASAGTCDLLL
jgi:hypothetical protein